MLEAIVSLFLKEYLKPLEPGQLDLEVLQGTMNLYNIQLLPTALTVRHIPFIIKKGCIKYAKIIFPWNNLKNAACEILIEDIFVTLQFESEILIKSDIQADQKSLHVKTEPNTIPRDEQIKVVQGLFESVIDNLRVQIKNVHLVVEFPCKPKPIIIGISAPEITFLTIDEQGKIINSIQHPKFVRKQFTIKDFSIYFDTNSDFMDIEDDSKFSSSRESIQAFIDTMMAKTKEDHQYIFSPTEFKSVLIHTKDKTQEFTNQVQTTIEKISINLDLPQCRSIIHLNYIWSQFMKRRKYASCMRPRTFNNVNEIWQYANKCAILKNRPYIFKPYLALTILKARVRYVELFKQAKVSKLSASLLGSPKQKLESLEKKIGPTASIYLREYSEAIYVKEESLKDSPDVTAFNISQLKSIFESTEFVFSMRQFSGAIEINSFNLEMLYEKDSPLLSVACDKLTGGLSTVENVVGMKIHVKDVNVVSYINDNPQTLFKKITNLNNDQNFNEQSDFIILNLSIPINDVITSFDCVIAPTKMTLDTETIDCILDFFNPPKQIDSEKGKTTRFEIGEILQYFKKLINYKMSVKISLMQYDFPFECANDEIKYLTFEMADLNFNKNLDQIVHKNAPELPMDFSGNLNLKAKIDNFTLFKTENINATINLVFVNGKLGVKINSDVDLSTFQIFLPTKCLSVITFAVSSIIKLPLFQSGIKINAPPPPVLIIGRSNIAFNVLLKALKIFLNDENSENEMKINIIGLHGYAKYYLSSFEYSGVLNEFHISQHDRMFVELGQKLEFTFTKKTESNSYSLFADVNVSKPHIYLEFKSILWLMDFVSHFKQIVPKGNQIQLNEEVNSDDNHQKPIKMNDVSVPNVSKSTNSILKNESRIQLAKTFTPSSIILTESILTQSISDFLQESSNNESSKLEQEEQEEDESQEDDNYNLNEAEKNHSLKMNLQVHDAWIEMIDRGPKKINSNFTIKSVKIGDFTSEGYKVTIDEFIIKRESRLIFYIPTFSVPINNNSSGVIDVVVDYAESHIYSGDIIALTYDSPTIFKMMFGGPTPQFKNKLVINALCKKGTGSVRYENNDPIAFVHVENPSACITFGPKDLDVDANLPICDGNYKDDNHHFLSLYNNFHAHYIGSMNDQSITIDVPNAKLSLKYLFFDWLLIFEPLTRVDKSTLQPLKIQINVQPCQMDILASKAEFDSNKFELLASKAPNMFTHESNEKFGKVFSFQFGKSTCTAIRDKDVKINLKMNEFDIKCDVFDHSLFGVSNIHFKMSERLVKLKIPTMRINMPVPILSQIINDIPLFIPEKLLPPPSSSTDICLPTFGIDLKLQNFTFSVHPSSKVTLQLAIPDLNFILNSSHNIAGLVISSIRVLTISDSDNPAISVKLSKIESFTTFAEKSDIDISKFTFESIKLLPQKATTNQPLKCLYFTYKMGLIQVDYSHFFAKTLICTVFKTMFNCKSLPSIPAMPIENFSKIKFHLDCLIEKIQINFVIIIHPFASVTFTGIKLVYDENWKGSINDLSLLPITKEAGATDANKKSLITKKNINEEFITISIQDGQLFALLSENELNADFKLLFYITQFMMASPFLKINPVLAIINKSKNLDKVKPEMCFSSFSKSLPFDLILHMKKTHINVPITTDKETNRILQLHISALASITSTNMNINVSSLWLNFYDANTQTVLPSNISDFTFDFTVQIEEDSSLSLKATLLDFNLIFSITDLYFIILLARSIEDALNSQLFAFEETNFDIFQLRILSLELITSNMSFALCRNTKSSSEVVPIFRCVIPPMEFRVQKSDKNQISKTPVMIKVKPYVEYFNIVTGNFDLIVEPFILHIYAYIIDEQMTLGANVLDDINVNFPLNAVVSVVDLINNLNESLKKQKTIEVEDLPSMWLCNKLGSTVDFTVGKDNHSLDHNALIPLFGIKMDTSISFFIDENNYTIETNSFNYPTYLSRIILVVKKPYKGGMMISFERTYQIENNLSFAIDIYSSSSFNDKYHFVTSIEPNERQPFIFDKEVSISIIRKGRTKTIKHNIMKLFLLDKSLSIFTIIYDKSKNVLCNKTVYNDTTIAARIISINSQYLIYNLLPTTLYFKYDTNDELTTVERGETTNFYNVENDTFLAYLSLDAKKFLKDKSRAKINTKNTTSVSIFNPEDRNAQKCMVEFSYEKEINQTTIILYMPVVIYNMTHYVLDFEVVGSKNKTKNELNSNDKNELQSLPKSQQYWCPCSLNDNSNEDTLMITILANGTSKSPSKPFDCLTTGCETLFLPNLNNQNLFLPLRCNISNQSRTSILTLTPLIKMINNLDFDFTLIPIRSIPEKIKEVNLDNDNNEKEEEEKEEKKTSYEKLGSEFEFSKNSEISLPFIPKNGTFAISIKGFSTSPSLNLLEPQKNVFKVQNKNDYRLIELQVTDLETSIRIEFNKVAFPTPVLINNQLDIAIHAYQFISSTPFEVLPSSTSIFAFDEPFISPSVTLSFGNSNVYRISLVEDTEKIEMRKKYNDIPVYVQVKHNKYGNRLITITQAKDETGKKYKFIFQSSFQGIAASLIDLQMKEIALIYLSKLETKFNINSEYLAVNVTLKSIQIDDQNPFAPNPTVIYGYFNENNPYLSFNCLCPINTNAFTSFDYFTINMQRIDADIDGSFVSDWLNLLSSLNIKKIHSVSPKKPSKSNPNALIALRYFEITPSLFIFRYNRKTKRPPMLGKVPRFLNFIPSISERKMVLPGIFLSRITDRINTIQTELIDDYKTAAFNAILSMLGRGGKIIKILGIASAIASSFNIKMTSDLTSKISLNSFEPTTESDGSFSGGFEPVFDNQFDDEISSCFSYKSLSSVIKKLDDNSMNTSPLIKFTMPKLSAINDEGVKIVNSKEDKETIKKKLATLQKKKNNVIQSSGLQLKIMPGIGYGRGVAGVLTNELNDPLDGVELMSKAVQIRETRPLAGAKISTFSPAISHAQNIIFREGGMNENIKEISVSKDGDMKTFIIMTENTLYVFNGDLSEIIESVKFNNIIKVKFDKEKNEVTLKLKNGKSVVVFIESKISINFMLSLLRMNNRFDESLLL